MSKHLRILRGSLVGPNKTPMKVGDSIWARGERINDPVPLKLTGWSRDVNWPEGEVSDFVKTNDGYYRPEKIFASREDAITPAIIANDAEVVVGSRVWVYVRGYKGMVEKRVINYNADRVFLCYPDVYHKVSNKTTGKGFFVTSHSREDVYATEAEIFKAKKLEGMSAAPLRAVRKIVRMGGSSKG